MWPILTDMGLPLEYQNLFLEYPVLTKEKSVQS